MTRLRHLHVFAACAAALLAPLVACGSDSPVTEIHLTSGGIDRTCLVHAPPAPSAGRKPMPLLLVLHGGGGTAAGMVRLTKGRFNELSDRDRFLVAYPEGVGRSWNDGRLDIDSKSRKQNVDDVVFMRDLVEDLARMHPIDRSRIFAAGMSNGGMMVLRLACSLPGTIRGVAAVAASLPNDILSLCPARPAASVILVAGTADPIVPYDGGQVRVLFRGRGEVIGAARTASLWAEKSGCRPAPAETALAETTADGTRVDRLEYAVCDARNRVVLYRVEGGGHAWPGGVAYLPERLIGKTSGNLIASDAIWREFSSMN